MVLREIGLLASVVDLAQAGYPLIGGRIDMLDERPVAAIVYQHGNNFINLFVWSVASRKIDLNVRSDRGYQFCGWNKAGLNYFCISENELYRPRGVRGSGTGAQKNM